MPKPRFTVDVQTFTNAVIFLVAPTAIYFGFRGEKRTDEELEVEMAERQPSSMMQARKGSEALASIFAARKEDGSFDAEMEQKLDDLLRAGAKKRVRVNADNDSFHNRDGVAGVQRGVQFKSVVDSDDGQSMSGSGTEHPQEDDDWRVGLTGAEIIKERKRRQRRRRKERAKGDLSGEELLTQLMTLRAIEPQTEKVAKKKAKIKKALQKRGLSY